ncbi:hypothetical protein PVAP13_3KG033627 [Panicum virgatum]|uniref:Secreted protein n=1 Tax=Panicum virgatum TaxID=38727 RepID=A0A8T0ULA1_PANVG|nr:hypothetical protein PVAP13_3KG033627 [Panicum virgatum]
MKSAMSLCLLLWRQLVNLWRNRRGHEEVCCYYISWYCTVQNPIITLPLGLQVPKRQSKSCTEMGNKIKDWTCARDPFISNFQQVRESGLNFDQDSRSSPAYFS